jgi:hypothetical protein
MLTPSFSSTKLLTTKPYFILAYRRDGVVRMTERFERMWKNKEAYWEEESPKSNVSGPRPVKKRKKSKAVRAKTPIVFPNLHEEDDTMLELLSAQVDMGSRMQLASMAETALELSVDQGREELEERRAEKSFFAEFMVGTISSNVRILLANHFVLTERGFGI